MFMILIYDQGEWLMVCDNNGKGFTSRKQAKLALKLAKTYDSNLLGEVVSEELATKLIERWNL